MAAEQRVLSKEQEIDAGLATAMANALLKTPQMAESVQGMLQMAGDPVQPLGQILSELILNIKEQAESNGVGLDDIIWLAEGGVVDRVVDSLLNDLGMSDPGIAEAVVEEIMQVLKLAANVGPKGQTQASPMEQGPVMPSMAPQQGSMI